MTAYVSIPKIDIWAKLKVLKENPETLERILFRNSSKIKKTFLQAYLDAKLRIKTGSTLTHIDLYLSTPKRQQTLIKTLWGEFKIKSYAGPSCVEINSTESVKKTLAQFKVSSQNFTEGSKKIQKKFIHNFST